MCVVVWWLLPIGILVNPFNLVLTFFIMLRTVGLYSHACH